MSINNQNKGFGIGNAIALAGLIVAIVAIVIGVTTPEIRCNLGLEPCQTKTPIRQPSPDCPPFLSPGESCDTSNGSSP